MIKMRRVDTEATVICSDENTADLVLDQLSRLGVELEHVDYQKPGAERPSRGASIMETKQQKTARALASLMEAAAKLTAVSYRQAHGVEAFNRSDLLTVADILREVAEEIAPHEEIKIGGTI